MCCDCCSKRLLKKDRRRELTDTTDVMQAREYFIGMRKEMTDNCLERIDHLVCN